MRWIAVFALLAQLSVPASVKADAPQRVASLNMCTDQLVLALAEPEQIAGLSRFAGDRALSFAADQAVDYPHLPAEAEAVIALEPDLILAGQFTNRAAKQMLQRLGYRVEEIPFVRSLEDAASAIALVGELLGTQDRAGALIAQIDEALAASPLSPELSALIVQRRGYTTGTASLTADLLQALNITIASEDLVGQRGGFASLEAIVMAEPDVLITASLEPNDEDQGSALLRHPALAETFSVDQHMALPERLTLCPGPSIIAAIEHIKIERNRLLDLRRD